MSSVINEMETCYPMGGLLWVELSAKSLIISTKIGSELNLKIDSVIHH
jgi:hypothetical protein